jgi:hypothetical protein
MEWHPFNYENKKAKPEPPAYDIVWVVESGDGITLGYFDGFTFRLWHGSDDCEVLYWAEIDYPEGPK